jgi:hypothetical protein
MENNYQPFTRDIRFQLDQIQKDLTNCIIDNNRNSTLLYSLNYIKEKIELCENIIKNYDKHNFRLLADSINEILKKYPEIHLVNVHILVGRHPEPVDYSKQIRVNFQI